MQSINLQRAPAVENCLYATITPHRARGRAENADRFGGSSSVPHVQYTHLHSQIELIEASCVSIRSYMFYLVLLLHSYDDKH